MKNNFWSGQKKFVQIQNSLDQQQEKAEVKDFLYISNDCSQLSISFKIKIVCSLQFQTCVSGIPARLKKRGKAECGIQSRLRPKLYIPSTTIKTHMNLVLLLSLARLVLQGQYIKISAILLKYPTFESFVFIFSWVKQT